MDPVATTVPDYYRILDLTQRQHNATLSVQEVKAAYRRALLNYHPDKSSTPESPGSKGATTTTGRAVSVDDIIVAYKTLSNPSLRAEYDKFLIQVQTAPGEQVAGFHHTGLDTIDLDDMDVQAGTWTRSCRCGDGAGFLVSESQLDECADDGEIIVGCRRCSLWLRVLFAVDE